MNSLPKGWCPITLSDVLFRIEAGLNVKCIERPPTPAERGLVKISAVTWGEFDELQAKTLYSDVELDERNRIKVGDVLISRANTLELVGASVVVEKISLQLYLSDKVLRLVVPDEVKRWINYALKTPHLRKIIAESSSGNQLSMRNISQDKLRSLPLPLAPKAEISRVTEKLDTVLARVDSANARLARITPLLKRFRQSVLAAATSGRLTEDWRSSSGNISMWESENIGELIVDKPRNGYSPKAVDQETPVRSLTLSATTSGRFRPECFKYVPNDIGKESHLWLKKGDVLIQRANSLEYVGVSAVVDVEIDGYIYPDLMMKCRANQRTSSRFLHLLLSSEGVRKYFRDNATGTAGNMPKINQQTVISAPCRLPSLVEQAEIVRRVGVLLAYADRLEARLQAAQTSVARLTPSLLAKAFRGELVPQDPDDEPAAELLKRLAEARLEGNSGKKNQQGRSAQRALKP